jgi:uncharacterized damage-inducible protein DinB
MADTVAPPRADPPLRVGEVETLRAFLTYYRDTLKVKCAGLDQAQLAQPLAPSTMTLGGMMKHLALVESNWFNDVFLGQPALEPWASVDWDADRDWEWHTAADDSPMELFRLFDEAVADSDRILDESLAGPDGLDALSVLESRRGKGRFSMRWIVVHMIEEYARHCGHADLIRESIDGQVGD